MAYKTIEIEGTQIEINKRNVADFENSKFHGQKLHHPFNFVIEEKEERIVPKKGNPYNKKVKSAHYTSSFTSSDVELDIKNATSIQIKHDGSCGFIMWNKYTQEHVPMTRIDLKKKNGKFPEPDPSWIQCEPMPEGDNVHWPHFRPCLSPGEKFNDKFQLEAFRHAVISGELVGAGSFTCEYMGRKVNYDKNDPIEHNALIVPHGSYTIEIPKEMRTFEGFQKVLEALPTIEGFVIYGASGTVYKIRRNMYKHDWPIVEEPSSFSIDAALIKKGNYTD